jgi:hypothetical protein
LIQLHSRLPQRRFLRPCLFELLTSFSVQKARS